VLEVLTPVYECTVFFYNPNIEPEDEFKKRKSELDKLIIRNSLLTGIDVLDCGYCNDVFAKAVSVLREEPEGRDRCRVCFELRLKETAVRAAEGSYDMFATTLSVSPHKDALLLNEIGSRLAVEHGVGYLVSDFKKREGYKQSIELSALYNLYRQSYCGCLSDKEATFD